MKRYICLILSIIMLISSAQLVSAGVDDNSDVTLQQTLLSDLGIITVPSENDSKLITRGEFSDVLYNAVHVEPMVNGYTIPYNDVDSTHKYFNAIYNIYAMGAISDSESFRPDDAITSTEALKMVVAILGYDFLALDLGGYPTGYAAASNRLGLLSGVSTTDFSRNDAYALVYNMLHCNMPGIDIKPDGNHEYYMKDSGTLLQERWSIEQLTGYVDEAQFFGTNNDDGVGEGRVGIDGMVFKKGDFDTDSLFGENVTAYYDTKDYTIKSICAENTDSKNVLKIFSGQNIEYKNNVYTYIDDEKDEEKSFTVSKNVLIIYNGKKTTYDSSIMAPKHGYVKYIKNGGFGDIVIIKSYTETLAGAVVAADYVISDKLKPGSSLYFDEETTTFYNQNGLKIKISSILENDVLWIAKSLDNSITEVTVCSDAISGIYTGSSDGKVYIDGRSYDVTDEAEKLIKNDFRMGDNLTGQINPDGEIVWFISEAGSDSLPVGYLVRSMKRVKGISTQFVVRILATDNVIYNYALAPKFTLNGLSFTADEKSYNLLPKCPELNNSMAQGIVTYKVNKDNEIVTLNYADDVEGLPESAMKVGLFKNAEHTDTSDNYVQYQYEWGNIKSKSANRIFISVGSQRFIVPVPEDVAIAEDEDYKAEQLLYEADVSNQVLKAYTHVEGEIDSQYLVSYVPLGSNLGGVSASNYPYIVSELSQVINNELVEVEKLEVTDTSGATVNFYSEELGFFSSLGLKFGDLVKIEADAKNVATGVAILYRAGDKAFANEVNVGSSEYSEDYEKTVLNKNSGMGALSESIMIIGRVYNASGRAIQLLPFTYDPGVYDASAMTLYGVNVYNADMAMCDLTTKTITPTDSALLKSFKDFGYECDVMIVEMASGNCKAVYAYNLD